MALRNRLNMCTLRAQEDLRMEENIDAYSMNGDLGRASPTPGQMAANDDGEGSGLFVAEELGHSSEWKIESVIEWKRVVDIYFIFKGENPDGPGPSGPSNDTTE